MIFWAEQPRGEIGQDVNGNPCGGPNSTVASAAVTVQGDTEGVSILLSWSDYAEGSTQMSLDGDTFYGAVGPVRYDSKPNEGGSLTVRAVATDRNGRTSAPLQSTVQVAGCQATGPATNVS